MSRAGVSIIFFFLALLTVLADSILSRATLVWDLGQLGVWIWGRSETGRAVAAALAMPHDGCSVPFLNDISSRLKKTMHKAAR